jgi:hypothetical protein
MTALLPAFRFLETLGVKSCKQKLKRLKYFSALYLYAANVLLCRI